MCQHLFAYFFDYSIKTNVILFAKRLKATGTSHFTDSCEAKIILILQRIHRQLFVLGR